VLFPNVTLWYFSTILVGKLWETITLDSKGKNSVFTVPYHLYNECEKVLNLSVQKLLQLSLLIKYIKNKANTHEGLVKLKNYTFRNLSLPNNIVNAACFQGGFEK